MGIMFAGSYDSKKPDDIVYAAINTYWEEVKITLPELPAGMAWYNVVDTFNSNPILKGKDEIIGPVRMNPRSVRIFIT